jgi:hypothetical protein
MAARGLSLPSKQIIPLIDSVEQSKTGLSTAGYVRESTKAKYLLLDG